MEKISLSEIILAVNSKTKIDSDIIITDICTDTRKINASCLFVAIKGENFDGHDFIENAFKLGASAVLSHKQIQSDKPIILVKDTKIAYGDIAKFYRKKLNPIVIGVTGSVGKTSTKEMIAQILSQKYNTHKNYGNLNNEIGLPKTLLDMSAEHETAVIEMGMSDLGEISYLSKIARPNIGVITNTGVSHLENLKSRENILKAKLEILDGMDNDAKIVLNADNDMLCSMKDELNKRAVFVGINNEADYMAKNITEKDNKTTFTISYEDKNIDVTLPLVGEHNIYNALIGFAIGKLLNVHENDMIKAMSEYKNAYMRQNIFEHEGIIIIEDCYNASPDSMNSAIDVITKIQCGGKRYAVFGAMKELGENSVQMHRDVGIAAANSKIDVLLTYSQEAKYIAQAAKENGLSEAHHFEDVKKLSEYIKANVKKSDAIIFKASRSVKLEEAIKISFNLSDN